MKRKASAGQKAPKVAKKRKTTMNMPLQFQRNTLGHGSELKNIDVIAGTIAVTGAANNPAAGTLLNPISQGPSENQRIGRKTAMKSLLFNWEYNLTVASSADVLRIILVYDKQSNANFPLATDILLSSGGNAVFTSPMQLSNADRFTILANKIYQQNTANCFQGGSIYVKMDLEAIQTGAGGTIATFNTGAIYAMAINGSGAASTLTFTSRVRYTDA